MPTTYVSWITWFDQREYEPPTHEQLLITDFTSGRIELAWWDGSYWHLGWSVMVAEPRLWSHLTVPVKISGPFSLDFLREE